MLRQCEAQERAYGYPRLCASPGTCLLCTARSDAPHLLDGMRVKYVSWSAMADVQGECGSGFAITWSMHVTCSPLTPEVKLGEGAVHTSVVMYMSA